jgi:hypothetical protein
MTKTFYKLIHKKHKRIIYFTNEKKSIDFIKQKMNSSLLKRCIHFLIRTKILLPFLQKVEYDIEGHVILIANRIKFFDLNNKIVYNYPLDDKEKIEKFRKTLNIRLNLNDKPYAPKVLDFNYDDPSFVEEYIEDKWEDDYMIPLLTLINMNAETGLIHGDIMKDHILRKGDQPVFIDWENSRKSSAFEDIKNFKVGI